jgi:hypothetical protein
MDARLSITRPGKWQAFDTSRPRCPNCHQGGFPMRFEPRLHVEVRVISTFAPEHARLPTVGAAGDPHYHSSFQHKCKRILEFRQWDPAVVAVVATLKAAA